MLFGDNMFVGNTAVDAAYVGNTQVWSAIPADVKAHIARVTADGGTVPEQAKMVSMVKKLIAANLWNNCVFFGLPLGGVKKDGNEYVSKVYDLKANADLLQATGTAQPKYNQDGALQYDGGDYLTSGVLNANNPIKTATTNATYVTWVKSPTSSANKHILNRGNIAGSEYAVGLVSGASTGVYDRLRCFVSSDGTTVSWKNYLSSKVVFDNNWHHIALTFSTNTLRIYVDGIEDLSPNKLVDATVNSIVNNTNNVCYGGNANGSLKLSANAQTALPQIYNSTLTAEQILWNYNNIRPEGV